MIVENPNKINSYVLNALTIDVEEWYQTILFNRNRYDDNKITDLPESIIQILSFLKKYNTKATFFIVASLVKKYPNLVKTIVQEGHEISSHGYLHRLVYKISRKEFINDIALSLDVLRKHSNTEIIGYRAPTWSITKKSYWAIDILSSFGLKYDSSIYPVSMNLCDFKKHHRFIYEIKNNFFEFPPSTFQFLGYNFPFAGGTFLRFFNAKFIKNKITDINKKGNPALIYFHSWEFDLHPPVSDIANWKRFVQYGNLNSVKDKLRCFLEDFKFSTIKEVLRLN